MLFNLASFWPFVVQDQKNRQFLKEPEDWPMHGTFSGGLEFLELNAAENNWLLHIETFDPHEPFSAPAQYREHARAYAEEHGIRENCDWPPHCRNGSVEAFGITPEQEELCRLEYAALLAFCNDQLGRLLDAMDLHGLWVDTLLIVNTDHGFLLGEKGLIAKCPVPFYNEIARILLFIWDLHIRSAFFRQCNRPPYWKTVTCSKIPSPAIIRAGL